MPKTEEDESARYWNRFLIEEFQKESDRATVILVGSLLDNALTGLLRAKMVPETHSSDALLDGPTAPLGEFASKINVAYRLGLISGRFTKDLHIIRKLRNEFAHDIVGGSYEQGAVKDRIYELTKSSEHIIKLGRERKGFPEGIKGEFLCVASWMLFALNRKIKNCEASKALNEEWGYNKELIESRLQKEEKPAEK